MRWEIGRWEHKEQLTHSLRGVHLINGGAGSGLLCKVIEVLLPGANSHR